MNTSKTGRVGSSCFTSGSRRFIFVKIHERGKEDENKTKTNNWNTFMVIFDTDIW